MNKTLRYKNFFIVFFCLIIFSGCSIKDTVRSGSDEDALRERVMVYWDHKIKQEFDISYNFEDPYYRKTVNMVRYIKGVRTDVVKWKSVKIKDVKIEGDSAMVELTLRYEARLPIAKGFERDSLIKEKWVNVDGVWYHVPEGFILEKQRSLPGN